MLLILVTIQLKYMHMADVFRLLAIFGDINTLSITVLCSYLKKGTQIFQKSRGHHKILGLEG